MKKKTARKKAIPIGIKVIAVLYYIEALLGVILGFLSIINSGKISNYLTNQASSLSMIGPWIFITVGITLIGFGIFGFFIGRDLLRLKNWARISVIILSILGVLISILSTTTGNILNGIFSLIIDGIVGWYLLFNKKVKQAFD